MSLNLKAKQAVVTGVKKALDGAQTVVIAQYSGVAVDSMTSVRKMARSSDVYLHVIKNTLAKRAVDGTEFAELSTKMKGQLLYSISKDPIAAAKIVQDFARDNEAVKVVAGMYNGGLLDAAGVKKLASIPSRNELLAMLMGVMQQVPAGLLRVLVAIKEQKAAVAA